jgi:hypothetical protein
MSEYPWVHYTDGPGIVSTETGSGGPRYVTWPGGKPPINTPSQFTVTPHSWPERSVGGPCSKCGDDVIRTYYSDVEIAGQHRAIVLEVCTCQNPEEIA